MYNTSIVQNKNFIILDLIWYFISCVRKFKFCIKCFSKTVAGLYGNWQSYERSMLDFAKHIVHILSQNLLPL